MRTVAAALVLVAVAAPARAADPVLHVHSRLRVDVDTVERVVGGLEIRGSLRDDASDEPVAGRTVAISVESSAWSTHYAQPTGPDGTFRYQMPAPLGTYRLRIAAGGDGDYVAAAPVERTVDVARRTPTVTLHLPERLPAHAPSLHVVVEAHESDGSAGPPRAFDGHAWVFIDGKRRTELGGNGWVGGRAESDEMGPFGRAGQRIEVSVTIDADELRNGARAARTVLLTTPTTLTLTADADAVAPDGRVGLVGQLRDDDGPVAGAEVVLGVENGADLATTVTGADGRFATTLRGRDLPAANTFVEARFRPRDAWREASVSPTVPLQVLPAPPVSVWPYLVSPALSLLAAAVVFAARDRRWRAWWARRRVNRAAAAAPPAPGLTESRPRLLSSLRGRVDHGVTGVVVDAADDRPLPTATVVARSADGSRAAAVDETGRFAFESLPAGPLVVDIAAPGYVGERFNRALPHRGELRGVRVRLVPVRARIFDVWRRVAAPLYPSPRVAETMTPRELYRHVDRGRILPSDSLEALTALVELAVWGARAPSGDELAAVERLARQLTADS